MLRTIETGWPLPRGRKRCLVFLSVRFVGYKVVPDCGWRDVELGRGLRCLGQAARALTLTLRFAGGITWEKTRLALFTFGGSGSAFVQWPR